MTAGPTCKIMTLKRIKLINIQCHKELDIELPETGVIAFVGNNSNGKSVITKVLKCLLSNQFQSKPKVRASMINRNATFGRALFVRSDDASLLLHLTRDAASTYLELTLPGEEPVQRYLADKCFPDLCHQFGWHYSSDRNITLNIAELDEALLFFATSYGCNYDILETALSDTSASMSLERIQAVCKEAAELKDISTSKISTCNSIISGLKLYDIEAETARFEELSSYYNVLSKIYIPVLPKVYPVPNVQLRNIYRPRIPSVSYPKFYSISCRIPDIRPLASELNSLLNKVCPVCGRRFIDGE